MTACCPVCGHALRLVLTPDGLRRVLEETEKHVLRIVLAIVEENEGLPRLYEGELHALGTCWKILSTILPPRQ